MLFSLSTLIVYSQTDTIGLGNDHLHTDRLKPGLNQYLVYFQSSKAPKILRFWYWLRDIKTESRNGEPVFTIKQHWYGSDTISYREAYSVNRAADFAPLYFSETIKGKRSAYNWSQDGVRGADTVTDNGKKGFKLDFSEPNFNWNLDIETFEMLPLAAGKTFAINFYDAGLDPPKYVIYKVTGSDMLPTLNGLKVDCWRLRTDGEYAGGHFSQTFWISKKDHEFLKEEDDFNGRYRYKLKMMGAAVDLLPRFVK